MAPSNNRSTSPTQPPQWLVELLREIQHIRADFSRQDSSIRELRAITLDNQQLLRTRLHSSLSSLTQTGSPPSNRISRIANRPATTSSIVANILATPQRQRLNATQSRANNLARNEVIRSTAVPIPRPVPASASKTCWYHRQFGATSATCIPPCNFIAPTVIPDKPKRRVAQTPATTQTAPSQPINPIQLSNTPALPSPSIVAIQTQSAGQQPAEASTSNVNTDWNKQILLDNPPSTLSSSSSSSSSSSDPESSQDETRKRKNLRLD